MLDGGGRIDDLSIAVAVDEGHGVRVGPECGGEDDVGGELVLRGVGDAVSIEPSGELERLLDRVRRDHHGQDGLGGPGRDLGAVDDPRHVEDLPPLCGVGRSGLDVGGDDLGVPSLKDISFPLGVGGCGDGAVVVDLELGDGLEDALGDEGVAINEDDVVLGGRELRDEFYRGPGGQGNDGADSDGDGRVVLLPPGEGLALGSREPQVGERLEGHGLGGPGEALGRPLDLVLYLVGGRHGTILYSVDIGDAGDAEGSRECDCDENEAYSRFR